MLGDGGGPELGDPLFALAAVPTSDHVNPHRGISVALTEDAVLAEVGLQNHAEPGRLASLLPPP